MSQEPQNVLQTEYDFLLPRGFVGQDGKVHRTGRMRLATAMDEIDAMQDPRVQTNEAYLPVVLLSQVVIRLGDLNAITPQVIEKLFASDMAYLEDVYLRLNSQDTVVMGAACPHCGGRFDIQVAPLAGE
jgi:hypothetical protein